MALTPQQLAELQRLKQMYAPLVEAQRRKDQADANAQKMGLPLTPQGKAEGGLAEFLKDSAVKHPVYHASPSGDIKAFNSWSHFGTEKAAKNIASTKKGTTTYKVHLNVRKPLRTQDHGVNQMGWWNLEKMLNNLTPEQVDWNKWHGGKEGLIADWKTDQDPSVVEDFLRRNGYDSIVYKNQVEDPGSDSYIVFDPRRVKSATGNRGTYDTTKADITKAKGGSVSHDDVMHAMRKAKSGQDYMNCKLAVQLASGVSKIQDLPKVKSPSIGDIHAFGIHHYAVDVGNGHVVDVPEWGGGVEKKPLKELVDEYGPATAIHRPPKGSYLQHKATGGSIPSQDVMRLAIGGQGPRNFLKGTVEKVIDPLKSQGPTEADRQWLERHGQQNPEARQRGLEAIPRTEAINQWIERNLGNYIRKQMGHPNDPVRKLAEEGILHFDPDQLGIDEEKAESRRQIMGGQKLAKGPLAQAWENAVDYQFEPNTVEDIKAMPDIYQGMHEPWMDKADPKTMIYELYNADELGFDHIVDILKEDMAEGRIRPEQLSKVSIEHAVRRAHEYDQEKKRKMAETAFKATEGMPVHKEYPEGFKWIELAMPEPETEVPDTHELEQYSSKVHGTGYRYVDKQTGMKGEGFKTPERATEEFLRSQAEDKLDKALKYEGDTMGHCVGGYTPDVASGKTRIFSLRDAKNEPHVTIEVKPNFMRAHEWLDTLSPEKRKEVAAFKGSVTEHPEYLAQKQNVPPMIKQIKGKGNAKPKKDYIPYVQDFVKSGKWSDVGDFHNTDLVKLKDHFANKLQKQYVTKEEFAELAKNPDQYLKPNTDTQMADGGEVDAEAVFMGKGGKVKELEQYLRDREGEYGVKRLQRAADEIPGLENMYTLQALKEAFGGDNAKALMTMNPADFERFAAPLIQRSKTAFAPNQTSIDKHSLPTDEYIQHLARIKGFSDVPFLSANKEEQGLPLLPYITGHEGRHRSRALAKMGKTKNLVRLIPSSELREPFPRRSREEYIQALKNELAMTKNLIMPEAYRTSQSDSKIKRPAIELPEIYKDGGEVDAEDYFFPKSKE